MLIFQNFVLKYHKRFRGKELKFAQRIKSYYPRVAITKTESDLYIVIGISVLRFNSASVGTRNK